MMAAKTMPCECRVMVHQGSQLEGPWADGVEIFYCPMHAAVPARDALLRDALEIIRAASLITDGSGEGDKLCRAYLVCQYSKALLERAKTMES